MISLAENKITMRLSTKADGASTSVKNLSKNLTTLGRNSRQVETGFNGLQKQLTGVNKRLVNLTKDSNRSNASLKSLNSTFSSIRTGIGTAQIYLLSKALQTFIQSSLDSIEVNNLFSVSLGDMRDSANDTLETMSDLSGLDVTQLRSATGTFALLARSMGINSENAETLSINMTKLSLDLSSLTNVPINQVMQDLRSGLVGQSETVYKYGLDVTEASLKQEAMNQGISKSVRNMSQGEKMALRYSIMIRKTALAQGDFAKTIETPANQLRILSSRMVTLARSIGNILIPSLSLLLPYLNAVVQVAIKGADALAKIAGFIMPDMGGALGDLESNADATTSAVGELDKAIKKLSQAGIDELNLIGQAPTASGEGVQVGDPNAFSFNEYNNFLASVKQKSDEIVVEIESFIDKLSKYGKRIFKPLVDGAKELSDALDGSFTWFINNILAPLGTFVANQLIPQFFRIFGESLEFLSIIIESAKPNLIALYENFLKPVGEFTFNLISEGLKFIADQLERLNNFAKENPQLMEAVIGTFTNAFIILASAGAIASLIRKLSVAIGLLKLAFETIFTPMNIIIGLILIIAGYLIYLYNTNEDFRNFVDEAWTDISNIIGGVVEDLGKWFSGLWNDHLKPLWEDVKIFAKSFSELFMLAFGFIMDEFINPFIESTALLLTHIFGDFTSIGDIVDRIITTMIIQINGLILMFTGLSEFLLGVFTGDVDRALNGILTIFEGFLDMLGYDGESIMMFIVDMINGVLTSITGAVNKVIKILNGLSFKVPDWVPEVGGKEFGFGNLREFNAPQISYSVKKMQSKVGSEFASSDFVDSSFNSRPSTDSSTTASSEMYKAVYDAIVNGTQDSAISGQSGMYEQLYNAVISGMQDANVNVNIDPKQIGKSVTDSVRRSSKIQGKEVVMKI